MADQLIWTCSKPNIALHLRDRELGIQTAPAYRHNCRMWRTLICDGSSIYKKTWSLTSNNRIHYLGDRLYLDNFRTCYSLNGPHAMPAIVYKNPDRSHTYKLEASLHCSAELNILPMVDGEHRPYVLGLTKCQNLIRIDLQTGRILKKIYLGHHHSYLKYIYLNWDVFQERAVVCSTTQSKSTSGIMKSFVLFSVFPLEVVGHLTISPQVFGTDICNANITDGMLIVMHRNDRVRMYSLDKIINEDMTFHLRLGEVAETTSSSTCSSSSGAVGSFPIGIPVNIHIADCPPVLLDVRSLHHDVWFGGFPWHYMYIPHANDGLLAPHSDSGTETYIVASVATNQMVESGVLQMDSDAEDDTMACFHMDDSQRIIQLGDYDIIVNAFHTRDDGKSELRIAYKVNPPLMETELGGEKKHMATWETTLSGRRVSTLWRKQLRERYKIRDVNFDNELDFLLVTFVTTADCSSVRTKGNVGIYCNQTGRLLKMVELDTVDFDVPHGPTLIEMDMDFMIHIYGNAPGGKMMCTLYRLQRPSGCVGQHTAP